MRLRAPKNFRNASEFGPGDVGPDPRDQAFAEDEFVIDLRSCEFVRPPAALWCLIELVLATRRGSRCELLVPENLGVATYLSSMGLFSALVSAGVQVDDRGVRRRKDPKAVLPLRAFTDTTAAESLANDVHESLRGSGLGAPNLDHVVAELFGEIALNAAQHSESPVGAYGVIQFYEFETGSKFSCAVADGGIGIRESLARNPELAERVPYDWVAVDLALRERISGTGDPHRGIGLYGVSEDMRRPGRSMIVHSGIGSVEITEEVESAARRTCRFPGTLVHLSIPT